MALHLGSKSKRTWFNGAGTNGARTNGARINGAGIKRAAIAILGSIVAAGMIVLGFFALTAALAVSVVAFLIGAIWWKLSGKKRFQAVTSQAFGSSANAAFVPKPHAGRVIEGEVVSRD